MTAFFENNLLLLSEYDPELADRLRLHTPSDRIEVFMTPSRQPSLRVLRNDKPCLLHSSRDPIREAERWISTLELSQNYNLLVCGAGLMHHLFQLVLRYKENIRNLVVLERDVDILHAAFTHVDLSPFLRTKSTFFLANPSSSELRRFMNDHLTPFVLDGLEIILHPASYESDQAYYDEIRSIVDESLQGGEILLRTKVHLGGIIQENIIRNIPAILSNPTASALRSIFTNIPAFIVGAGPSLDRNIEQLRQVEDRGLIVAVDTVFKQLRDKGILPHIVVTSDPTTLNVSHFKGIESLGETILVFSPSAHHKILQQLQGTKVSMPLPVSRMLNTLTNVLGDMSYMTTGTNVGQSCFNLARFLGCNPIVLVGMDLSFSPDGGNTHSSRSALCRKIFSTGTPGKMKVELLGDKPELEEFEPIFIPGNEGRKVATNKFWLAYLRSLEEEIKKTEARIINCTEGGASIEGTEIRTLSDVIQEICIKDEMVLSTLQMSVGFFFGSNMDEGVSTLNEALEILQEASSKAEEGLQQVAKLEKVAGSVSPDSNLIVEQMQEISRIHLALIQNHKVYAVLDEAADRVLHPFIRREGRPEEGRVTPENIENTTSRYRPYFSGMKELCEQYSTVIRETLYSMDTPSMGF